MITFQYKCPHCGNEKSGFEVRAHYENTGYSNRTIFSILAICNTCCRSIISDIPMSYNITNFKNALLSRDNYYNLDDLLQDSGTYHTEFFPKNQLKTEIPENLPDSVINELNTAEDLYIQVKAKPHFIKVSGNAYRTTLERALCELAGNNDRARLDKRIQKLFEIGKLTEGLKDFALRIRALSADASHTYNDFSSDDLDELRIFTQLFLRYTFTLPAMIPNNSKENVSENKN